MGNTDLYRPLHAYHLLGMDCVNGKELPALRNVFIISDGHWADRASLYSAVQKHAQHLRVFTMGVRFVRSLAVGLVVYPTENKCEFACGGRLFNLLPTHLVLVRKYCLHSDVTWYRQNYTKSSYALKLMTLCLLCLSTENA
jgi:hypothetical protein